MQTNKSVRPLWWYQGMQRAFAPGTCKKLNPNSNFINSLRNYTERKCGSHYMPIPTNSPSAWQWAKQNQKAKSRGAAHPPAQSTYTCCQPQLYFKTNLSNNNNKILGCQYDTELQSWTHFLFPLSIYFGCSGTEISEMGKGNTTWTVSTILSHSDTMER